MGVIVDKINLEANPIGDVVPCYRTSWTITEPEEGDDTAPEDKSKVHISKGPDP